MPSGIFFGGGKAKCHCVLEMVETCFFLSFWALYKYDDCSFGCPFPYFHSFSFFTFNSSSNIYLQSGFSLLLFTTTDHRTQMFWASLKQSVFGDIVTQGGQVQ